MDHVDIAASTEISNGPLTALQVRIPFTAAESSTRQRQQPAGQLYTKKSIAKPTLSRFISVCLPVEKWVPDSHVACCTAPECQLPFSLFLRKHHCRACGRIFCANCSSHVLAALSPTYLPNISQGTPTAHGKSSPSSPAALSASSMTQVRVCSECFYEHQLVVVRRANGAAGSQRRRTRGELKMFQWSLIVHILSFLPLSDQLTASAVSSDFYFMSRDNQIWFVHNMNRWGAEIAATSQSFMSNTANTATSLEKATISHHARYNFTQFLDFARRLEGARCQGLSSFSAGAKQLLSAPIKVCFIGPPSVGKTLMIKRFMGEISSSSGPGVGGSAGCQTVAIQQTIGFSVYTKRVAVVGGLTSDVILSIIDIAGDKRYEQLRALCAQSAHVVVVCYSAHNKMSLVHAATQVTALESFLGPQPAIVCGIIHDPSKKRDVTSAGAEGISVRCRASIQTDSPEEIFQTALQTLLDKLVLGSSPTAAATPTSSPSSSLANAARNSAQALLSITANPGVLDVLLDPK